LRNYQKQAKYKSQTTQVTGAQKESGNLPL